MYINSPDEGIKSTQEMPQFVPSRNFSRSSIRLASGKSNSCESNGTASDYRTDI